MLKYSRNLYAETVLWLTTGTAGPRATGPALVAVRDRLAEWGIAGGDHQIVDGSGLSRRNTVTARALVTILNRFYDPGRTSPWMQALPVAGRDGTLATRLAGTPAENNLAAKTGSMSNIRSLAGYVRTVDGEALAFAVIVNNFEGSGRDAEAAIDWLQPAQKVYDLIRGCNPQPGAHTTFRGGPIKIFDCRLGEAAGEAPPGEVTSVSPDEIAVALAGGSLRVHRVQPKGSPKQKAPEFVAASGIKAGERFGA